MGILATPRAVQNSGITGVSAAGLSVADGAIAAAIVGEKTRQRESIELIASENFVSQAVLDAQGSVLTNKYAEGYPHRRYYGGCGNVDVVEDLAIKRVNKLFGSTYANVQPHSGSQANQSVFLALLNPGDTILGLDLKAGGHLTHGAGLRARTPAPAQIADCRRLGLSSYHGLCAFPSDCRRCRSGPIG